MQTNILKTNEKGQFISRTPEEVQEFFWNHIDKNGPTPKNTPELGPCWVWTGAKAHWGYGQFAFDKKNRLTHRVSWEFCNGSIPDGLWILHKCDNPACCNPGHLFVGTSQENSSDMCSKRRQSRGKKHSQAKLPTAAKGIGIGIAKLTDDKVREIRELRQLGMKYEDLAQQFDVCSVSIRSVVSRKTWKHVL